MKEKTVGFYKRLILLSVSFLILVPATLAGVLFLENRALASRLQSEATPSDDSVTVGAMQLEPAGIAREKPVLTYQTLYPDFNANFYGFDDSIAGEKTVYLTFDDGPSTGTSGLLDILAKREIKATFFVNGKSNRVLSDSLKRIHREGHSVGMHGYTHRYNIVYANMENLLDDLYRNFMYIKAETGIAPEILRFPGGSINIFNVTNYQAMVAEVLRRGFIYYDWNVSAGDAVNGATPQAIANNVINGVRLTWGPAIVLMHDTGNAALREALGTIIDTLADDGYRFERLDNSIKPPMFIYPD